MNSIEAMKQALEASVKATWALAHAIEKDSQYVIAYDALLALTPRLRQAIAEAEKQDNGKFKVTLEDTPTEIELAQYKRMFEAACSALGAVGDALGVDPEEGGAEPILAAIQELKAEKQEPVAVARVDDLERGGRVRALAMGLSLDEPLYTSPPTQQSCSQRPVAEPHKPLTDEQVNRMANSQAVNGWLTSSTLRAAYKIGIADAEAAHGIKGEA